MKDAEGQKVTFKEALFGEKYWRSTWLSFGLGVGNQLSAIGPVTVFASTLLADIESSDPSFPLTIKEGVLLITTGALVFGWLGIIPAKYFGRKRILVICHAVLTIEHAIIGILSYN